MRAYKLIICQKCGLEKNYGALGLCGTCYYHIWKTKPGNRSRKVRSQSKYQSSDKGKITMKKYSQTESFKSYKRKYMREYMRLRRQKTRELNAASE